MTKRQKKKAEKIKREAIHEVLDLVLDINGLQASKRDTTGDHPTAFFYVSGHICEIETQIHAKGWYPYSYPDVRIRTRMDKDLSGAVRELSSAKAMLEKKRL